MSDSPAQPVRDPDDAECEASLAGYDDLRRLLFGTEQEQLAELQARFDDTRRLAADVSRALPDAVRLRSPEDQKLIQAIAPPVIESLKHAARRSPQRLSEALFPVLGPAIRKAIAHAFSRMTEAINQTLEYSLSPRSLKWRLEAWRTGKTFGEIVLFHTLLYRVEQVFLIHRETGLLLQHVAAEAVVAQDADLVSGMLTAIQDFVRDSFGGGSEATLEGVKFGDLSIWIEQGPDAIIAAAIRGFAPTRLHATLQEAIETIHGEQGESLEAFAGDTGPFELSRPTLEACLLSQYQAPQTKRRSPYFLIGLASAMVLTLALWGFFALRERQRWNAFLATIKAQQGVIVTEAEKRGGKYYIRGLRDPLAVEPEWLVKGSPLRWQDVEMQWEPYQSLQPDFVLMRARRILDPPPGVTLSLTDGKLSARGTVPPEWAADAGKLARAIPGVNKFAADLSDALRVKLEQEAVRFAPGARSLSAQESVLPSVVETIRLIDADAQQAGRDVLIRIVGQTDKSGTPESNLELSRARAEAVLAALARSGLNTNQLRRTQLVAEGVGDGGTSALNSEAHRRVSFKVEFIAPHSSSKPVN